jgi:hypothetical protein
VRRFDERRLILMVIVFAVFWFMIGVGWMGAGLGILSE